MRSYICKNLFFLTLVSFTAESVFALRMIDPHVHTASTAKDTSPYHPKQLVKIMNQFPYVETAFLLSRGYLKPERTYAEQENDHVAQTINEYPDRFIGFCGVNVFLPNALEEIERCHAMGLRGLKLHTLETASPMGYDEVNLQNPEHVKLLGNIFDKAIELNMIILFHGGYFSGKEAIIAFRMMVMRTKGTFIWAHGGNGFDLSALEFINYYYDYPGVVRNIYLDLSVTLDMMKSSVFKLVWVELLQNFGYEHLLLATDMPASGQSPNDVLQLFEDLFAPSRADLRRVIYENAKEIMEN